MYIYIYIYIEREREREGGRKGGRRTERARERPPPAKRSRAVPAFASLGRQGLLSQGHAHSEHIMGMCLTSP